MNVENTGSHRGELLLTVPSLRSESLVFPFGCFISGQICSSHLLFPDLLGSLAAVTNEEKDDSSLILTWKGERSHFERNEGRCPAQVNHVEGFVTHGKLCLHD